MMSTHVQQARFLLTLLDPVYFIPFPVRLRMDFTDLKKKNDGFSEFRNGGISFASTHPEPVTWADLY